MDWNIFYFHPYLRKWSNLTNIFKRGWNHQQEVLYHIFVGIFSSKASRRHHFSIFSPLWKGQRCRDNVGTELWSSQFQSIPKCQEWYRYNPPGWRGGPGRGYSHYNPPGWRGGPGHGYTHVHRNPYGWRGGPGHGTTVVHHHGRYGWGHGTTVYHRHGWRWWKRTRNWKINHRFARENGGCYVCYVKRGAWSNYILAVGFAWIWVGLDPVKCVR